MLLKQAVTGDNRSAFIAITYATRKSNITTRSIRSNHNIVSILFRSISSLLLGSALCWISWWWLAEVISRCNGWKLVLRTGKWKMVFIGCLVF